MTTTPSVTGTTSVRVALHSLACASTAWYVLHHRTIEAASLDLQNFCTSVGFVQQQPDTPMPDLLQLLAAGIEIVAEDKCASTDHMMIQLRHARQVYKDCTIVPERIEREVAPFGKPYGAVLIPRNLAQQLADQMVGAIIDSKTNLATPFLRGERLSTCIVDLSHKRLRIEAVRLEDDPDCFDGSRGRVIASCVQVQP